MMNAPARARRIVLPAIAAVVVAASIAAASAQENQQTTPAKPPAPKGVVIRGCLTASTLIHIDPQNLSADLEMKVPDRLKVTSTRVIRDQVKALNGHQVEITGSLRGIPGMETGLLVLDSDSGKFYLGGDPKMGSDTSAKRSEPPTIYAQMIKDVAEKCASAGPSR